MWPLYGSIILGIAVAWLSRLHFAKTVPSTAHGSARWANENELVAAGLTNQKGVVLGQSKGSGNLLCHDGPEHVIAIAPTRGGKGVGLVVPTLLSWPSSAVVFDPKGENWQLTSGYRATLGNLFLFRPNNNTDN